MATRKLMLIFCIAILVLYATATGSIERRRPRHQLYPRQHRRLFERRTASVPVVNAEWVCKNPKTGDMMFILAEDVPGGNHQGQWQPISDQTSSIYQNQPLTGPTYPNSQPPIQGTTTTTPTPNSNGEGLIDVRMGQK